MLLSQRLFNNQPRLRVAQTPPFNGFPISGSDVYQCAQITQVHHLSAGMWIQNGMHRYARIQGHEVQALTKTLDQNAVVQHPLKATHQAIGPEDVFGTIGQAKLPCEGRIGLGTPNHHHRILV
ncbi:MAG: hypothetical protein AB7E78_12530 [Porticoccaceae bacterium]